MKRAAIMKGSGDLPPTTTKSYWSMWTGQSLTDSDVLEIQRSVREYTELLAEWTQRDQELERSRNVDS